LAQTKTPMNRDIRSHLTFWGKSTRYDKRIGTTLGTLCVIHQQPIQAIDGLTAYPVIWISDVNHKITQRRGYTRPVDFVQLYGEVEDFSYGDMPDINDSDDIWDDYIKKYNKDNGLDYEFERLEFEIERL